MNNISLHLTTAQYNQIADAAIKYWRNLEVIERQQISALGDKFYRHRDYTYDDFGKLNTLRAAKTFVEDYLMTIKF